MSRVRVLVYWLESHHMLGWCMYIWLWRYVWLHDKTTFGSSLLLFVCCMFCMCGSLFLRWSSIYWCEQMWETPVANRKVMVLLR